MIPVLNKKNESFEKNLRLYTTRGYSSSLLLWQDLENLLSSLCVMLLKFGKTMNIVGS